MQGLGFRVMSQLFKRALRRVLYAQSDSAKSNLFGPKCCIWHDVIGFKLLNCDVEIEFRPGSVESGLCVLEILVC